MRCPTTCKSIRWLGAFLGTISIVFQAASFPDSPRTSIAFGSSITEVPWSRSSAHPVDSGGARAQFGRSGRDDRMESGRLGMAGGRDFKLFDGGGPGCGRYLGGLLSRYSLSNYLPQRGPTFKPLSPDDRDIRQMKKDTRKARHGHARKLLDILKTEARAYYSRTRPAVDCRRHHADLVDIYGGRGNTTNEGFKRG